MNVYGEGVSIRMKECVKVKENYGEKYKDFRLSKRFGNLLKRVEKGDTN